MSQYDSDTDDLFASLSTKELIELFKDELHNRLKYITLTANMQAVVSAILQSIEDNTEGD